MTCTEEYCKSNATHGDRCGRHSAMYTEHAAKYREGVLMLGEARREAREHIEGKRAADGIAAKFHESDRIRREHGAVLLALWPATPKWATS